MEAEKTYSEQVARIIQQKARKNVLELQDNRQNRMLQALAEPVQRLEDEDEMLQGKFENPVQREEDEAELLQGKKLKQPGTTAEAMKKMMNLCRENLKLPNRKGTRPVCPTT